MKNIESEEFTFPDWPICRLIDREGVQAFAKNHGPEKTRRLLSDLRGCKEFGEFSGQINYHLSPKAPDYFFWAFQFVLANPDAVKQFPLGRLDYMLYKVRQSESFQEGQRSLEIDRPALLKANYETWLNEAALEAFAQDYGEELTANLVVLAEAEILLDEFVLLLSHIMEPNHEDFYFWISNFLRCSSYFLPYLSLRSHDWMDDKITRREDNNFAGGKLIDPFIHPPSDIYDNARGRGYPDDTFETERFLKEARAEGFTVIHLFPQAESQEKPQKRLAKIFGINTQ